MMQKAEFQIVFRLLLDKSKANSNYRRLATEAGTSIGSVHNTMQNLTEKGYIVEDGKKRLLRKRSSLLDRWARAYADGLKERYLIARFTFLTPQVKEQWRDIRLPETVSWGGEPAAALLDDYLQPERWDIYTADNANALIATGRMIPKADGEIYVYRKFWDEAGTPPVVVYADLLATDNDRCREAAERILVQLRVKS
ncbi:MAG: hypothetical protein IJR04_07785 [Bacteroidales bacterium]|nr:hypothetical protein [Bacteroidales bacterium]